MAALPALARALRYGDVRGTDTGALGEVAGALIIRDLRRAARRGDQPGGRRRGGHARRRLDAVHAAVGLHAQSAGEAERAAGSRRWPAWPAAGDLHGLLAGRVTRLLVDAGS